MTINYNLVITPAPIVKFPSLITNFKPKFKGTGFTKFTVKFKLSPGKTKVTLSGKIKEPVTFIVLKKNCGL